MEFNSEIFGERLRTLRHQQKTLTTVKLGKALGVTDTTITNWELGKRIPSVPNLYIIAQFFNVPAGYLLGLEELKNTPPHAKQ